MSKMEQIERFLADSKSPVQLVKHWDDVKEKPEYPLVVQAKLDGVYSLIVKENLNVQVFTRTGKRMYKEVLTIEDDVLNMLSDGVFIAELVSYDLTLEELSGMVNPNRKEAWTPEQVDKAYGCMWAFHDYITHDELLLVCHPRSTFNVMLQCRASSLLVRTRYQMITCIHTMILNQYSICRLTSEVRV